MARLLCHSVGGGLTGWPRPAGGAVLTALGTAGLTGGSRRAGDTVLTALGAAALTSGPRRAVGGVAAGGPR